jgi:alpha-glucosidase (family GH31 glycosyl hydrolase)
LIAKIHKSKLCRYGYANTSEIITVVEENRDAGIPYDTQYADIDYMERQLDFTLSEEHFSGLPDYIEHIRKEYNMRFILIFDPAISAGEQDPTQDKTAAWKDKDGNIYPTYQKGLDKDVYIRGTDGEIEMGKVNV